MALLWLEEKLAMGYTHLRVISPGRGGVLAERLREAGYAVTEVAGRGRNGTVNILNLTVPRKRVPAVRRIVIDFDQYQIITILNPVLHRRYQKLIIIGYPICGFS